MGSHLGVHICTPAILVCFSRDFSRDVKPPFFSGIRIFLENLSKNPGWTWICFLKRTMAEKNGEVTAWGFELEANHQAKPPIGR